MKVLPHQNKRRTFIQSLFVFVFFQLSALVNSTETQLLITSTFIRKLWEKTYTPLVPVVWEFTCGRRYLGIFFLGVLEINVLYISDDCSVFWCLHRIETLLVESWGREMRYFVGKKVKSQGGKLRSNQCYHTICIVNQFSLRLWVVTFGGIWDCRLRLSSSSHQRQLRIVVFRKRKELR